MRVTFKIISLLLCLELIIGPFQTEFGIIGSKAFADTSCPAGLNFDSTLNRCLTSVETANVMNATASCAQGDVQCYKTNAQNAFQDKVNKGDAPERKENSQFVSTVANAAAIAGPVTMAALGAASGKSTCASASYWALVGGSLALVTGDNLANFLHKKRLKGIRDDWGKIVNPEDANGDKDKERATSIEAQSQAFEMLARSEDSMVKAAKMKKNLFLVAGLAYSASAIIASMEILATSASGGLAAAANICKPSASENSSSVKDVTAEELGKETIPDSVKDLPSFSPSTSSFKYYPQFDYNLRNSQDIVSFIMNKQAMELKYSSPSIDTYYSLSEAFEASPIDEEVFSIFKSVSLTVLENLNPLQTSYAQTVQTNAAKAYKEDTGSSSNLLLTAGLATAAGLAAKKFIGPQLIESKGRAIFSGVMAGMSFLMATHAGSQAEASQRRADLLRKMRDDFVSASGALNACKSEDRNDPAKPNCYCYTSDNQKNANRNASTVCQKLWTGVNTNSSIASTGTATTSDIICITKTNQADPSCSCKTNNTCMKVSTTNLSGLSASTATLLNSAISPLNSLTSGTASAANLDSSKLANQAMQMQSAMKQLATNKATKDLIPNKDQQEAKLTAELNKASAGMGSGGMLGATGSSAMPSNPGQAAVMLEKELNDSKASPSEMSSPGVLNVPAGSAKTEQLEFGLTTDQAAAQETQIAEVMKKDLDYGGNDINQGSKTNIFEVLSNRYQRSGMRRLFDEKGTTQADKPAQTDIGQ